MAIIVQKFGGTSVANPQHIETCVRHTQKALDMGFFPVVVVSAMAGTTDTLESLIQKTSLTPDLRERDMVLASGEQVTAGLFAMTLQKKGLKARSFTAWQIPLVTDPQYGQAKILSFDIAVLRSHIDQGIIPVVTGFQGVSHEQCLTTLGRGGSDLTAVTLAKALKAQECCLYKDVPGYMTADPKCVENARLIPSMSYDAVMELAALGSRIIQTRAAKVARMSQIPLSIRPTFDTSPGTRIFSLENSMDTPYVSSLIRHTHQMLLTMSFTESKGYQIFMDLLKAHKLEPDMHHFWTHNGGFMATCTLEKSHGHRAQALAKNHVALKGSMHVHGLDGLGKISLVGGGLGGGSSLVSTLWTLLHDKHIQIHGLHHSETRLSLLVDGDVSEFATRLIHDTFCEKISEEKTLPSLKGACQ